MPPRRPTAPRSKASPPARVNFRRRYDEIEVRRTELVARLRTLSAAARLHPGYKRTLILLNDTFRKSKLTQRMAVLQAASWLIDVLEQLTGIV